MFRPAARDARIDGRDQLVGLALGVVYVTWLLATARELGFARDEGFYFHAAQDYGRWFEMLFEHPAEAFRRENIDGIWATNHEHPALVKSLFALSHTYLYTKHHWFADASTAFRFPTMCFAGVGVWVTYLFGARAYSRPAGLLAAALFALMPRVFYNAHLACFDVPIATMWLLSIYVYWRSIQEGGLGWALLAGVTYGLTLDTKHNSWILPAVFVTHAFWVQRKDILSDVRRGQFRAPLSVVSMLVIGPIVFVAMWPWLWNDTMPRISEYMSFHLHHEYYNIEFLGKNYFGPPSPKSYMPVMILATVPTTTVALMLVGFGERVRHALRSILGGPGILPDRAATDLLIVLSMLAAVGPFFLAKTPIFGGTKHWLPAYPFLALLAGRGGEVILTAARRTFGSWSSIGQKLGVAGVSASMVVAPLVVTAHSHPFGLASYVPFVGGTAGGATLGLNRQFWGYTTESANADYLEANAPHGARVFMHDTAWDSWARMTEEHRVRSDLRGVNSPQESDIALLHWELHMTEVEYGIWVVYGTRSPVHVVAQDGVPIVLIYARNRSR
ncbi:MAG TPA: glycosyltransferase family 39 protein [Polyangiaceae bacterium]|nr:glycosyltransferase family 39 protein [Polyangiaceae bacterium]